MKYPPRNGLYLVNQAFGTIEFCITDHCAVLVRGQPAFVVGDIEGVGSEICLVVFGF